MKLEPPIYIHGVDGTWCFRKDRTECQHLKRQKVGPFHASSKNKSGPWLPRDLKNARNRMRGFPTRYGAESGSYTGINGKCAYTVCLVAEVHVVHLWNTVGRQCMFEHGGFCKYCLQVDNKLTENLGPLALSFDFPVRICNVFWISKYRWEWDLSLCTTSGIVKRMPMRSGDFWFQYIFGRKIRRISQVRNNILLISPAVVHRPRSDATLHSDVQKI